MRKFLLSFFAIVSLWLAVPCYAQYYDFSAVAPSGQTLYYKIINGKARVTSPLTDSGSYVEGDLIIPDSVYSNGNYYRVSIIGNSAFNGCESLSSVVIPNTVISIGSNAFSGCSSIISVNIPNSVTDIGAAAFSDCYSLASITIPTSVTSIGDATFYNCASITSITIPNSVTSIEDDFFGGCSSLSNVIIPNSVTTIGNRAFCECNALVNLIIPNSVTSIGSHAFEGCDSLTSVNIPNLVTNIGEYTFASCSALTNILIPSSVVSIGNHAFDGCSSLINVTIPNSVINLGVASFVGCSALISVNIPNSVTNIGDYAFAGCSALTSVNIPNSVTSIGVATFFDCLSLSSVIIPNTVTTIGDVAFEECYSLTSIIIPDFVSYIGIGAFSGCVSLSNITIPNSVTSIGNDAFWDCYIDTLNIARILPFPLTTGNDALRNANIINIPCRTTSNYQTTWGPGNYHEPDPAVLSLSVMDNERGSAFIMPQNVQNDTLCYGSNAEIAALPNYGYHFTQWNDGNTNNPRTITLTLDTSFTAIFAKNLYSVAGASEEYSNPRGEVTGSDTVEYLDTVTLTAMANYGYHFTQWTDGNTDNPRQIQATQDLLFTVQFDYNQYSITLEVNDTVRGTVSGAGDYNYLSQRTITANAEYGYHFNQWNDGNTDNPRTITLTQDTSFTAIFAKNLYSVVGASEEYSNPRGEVTGSDTVEYLDTVILTATANYGYHFTQWTDGNTDNPRQIQATQDLSFTAQFDYNQYSITLEVNDTVRGTVSGAGDYNYLSQRTLTASTEYGYHFIQWNDGNTDNPRTITLTQDTSFTAIFAKNLYSVVGASEEYSNPRGEVTGSDTVEYLDTVILTATANYGYHFTQWNDGNTDNPRQIQATQDLSFTAQFEYNQYSITLEMNDTARGTVSGAGDYNYLSQRTLIASAEYGYHFTQWNDGNTDNPRTITLTQDTSFTAIFAKNLYSLTVSSIDSTLGSVNGGGTYEYLDNVILTATIIAPHHHFVAWSDGVTDTMRTIIITEDLTLTAIFAIDTHHVNLMVNNENYGYVDGSGDYPYGSTAMVSATSYNGYYFVYWNNGDTINPNSFTVTADTLLTAIFAPEITPSLCMVTVQDDHNVLMWEKDQTVLEYNIYREGVVSGVYELMTTIPYNSLSTWTDISSQPSTRSYRYRISATDVNGHEADQSEIHKTMHLTINQGYGNQWNLVWTEYEGVDYTTYVIYRGRTLSEMQQIDMMPSGGNTTYTDVAPPTGSNKIYYQVGIIMSTPCNPTKNEDVVLSNIATNSSDGIEDMLLSGLQVYANKGQIVVNSEIEVKDVQVFDISGKLLKSVFENGNNSVINIMDFAAGVYIVRVNTINGPVTRKVVKK